MSTNPSLEVQDLFCDNPHCFVGHWVATLQSEPKLVWRMVAYFEDTPFLVAADHPVCPCCGGALLTHLEADGGLGAQTEEEQGPLFEFIRTFKFDR